MQGLNRHERTQLEQGGTVQRAASATISGQFARHPQAAVAKLHSIFGTTCIETEEKPRTISIVGSIKGKRDILYILGGLR